MSKRETSIDALRGLAILGMVLSGSILHGLPGWMYHAQVGPPDYQFNPNMPGITWVDLVFPFFLFAMGLAFPFSLRKSLERGVPRKQLVVKIVKRALKLAFFAIVLAHLSPYHYPPQVGWPKWVLALMGFLGFFMSFSTFPQLSRKIVDRINMAGYILLAALMVVREMAFQLPFAAHQHDIIILVLANMALFGALIWLYTPYNWLARLSVLPLYFALRVTHDAEGSWNQAVWNFSPLQWLGEQWIWLHEQLLSIGIDTGKTIFYNPEYLKYLFIVIPGSIVGDILFKQFQDREKNPAQNQTDQPAKYFVMAALMVLVVLVNLVGWYERYQTLTLLANLGMGYLLYLMLRRSNDGLTRTLYSIALWSIFWLILGNVFEGYEGGIKKDPATMSYFFITSGLSGFMLLFFKLLYDCFGRYQAFRYTVAIGKNPMVGYVAASFVIMPVLYFLQFRPFLNEINEYWNWLGLARGILVTSAVVVLTTFSVRKGYFWKT